MRAHAPATFTAEKPTGDGSDIPKHSAVAPGHDTGSSIPDNTPDHNRHQARNIGDNGLHHQRDHHKYVHGDVEKGVTSDMASMVWRSQPLCIRTTTSITNSLIVGCMAAPLPFSVWLVASHFFLTRCTLALKPPQQMTFSSSTSVTVLFDGWHTTSSASAYMACHSPIPYPTH